jgi:hypothetical protein
MGLGIQQTNRTPPPRRRWASICGMLLATGAIGALCLSAGVIEQAIAQPQSSGLEEPVGDVAPIKMRVMTEAQYRNTITNIFGADIKLDGHFAPVRRTSGLQALGTTSAGVSASDAEAFHNLAYSVASQVVDENHRRYLIFCQPADPKADDSACAARFLKGVGRLLYRRPLTQDELKLVVGEADEGAKRFSSFYSGLSFALGGMLASPKFLFVIERSEPDPRAPGQQRLTSFSLATRMSLLLWNAAPDDELLKAAESGKLQNPAVRARQVDAMIASPRFEQGVRAFFTDMFAFEDFNNLAKDGSIYPAFTGSSAADAAEQTLKLLVDHVVDKDADYRDVFTTRTTFLSPSLAPLYNLPAASPEWVKYQVPLESDRRGLLMQIGFLAAHSHPGRSSATKRGRALRELVLCQPVPDPPPNVDFTIVDDPNAKFHTARERLKAHRDNPDCAGCHMLTDPAGLALEHFDGAGQFRMTENGAELDTSGQLDGFKFTDSRGLSQAVHDNPATAACVVKRVFSYSTGRAPTRKDRALLAYFDKQFSRDGYRVKALMRAIATSQALARVSTAQVSDVSSPDKGAKSAPQSSGAAKTEVKS